MGGDWRSNRGAGGGGGQDGDGVADEAEDEVGGGVLLALDLVGEVQLARCRHGRRWRMGARVLGGKPEGSRGEPGSRAAEQCRGD